MWVSLPARIYGVFELQCIRCCGRVHLVGYITDLGTVRQMLEWEQVVDLISALAIAPAR